ADVALVPAEGVKLWIFRGPSQKKYDAEFAEALLPLGARVAIVKCEKSGRNALDMHIAFQMGRLVGELARDGTPQQASFVVVSRDTDYDPLLAYVRAQGFAADRATSLKAALAGTPEAGASAPKAAKARTAQTKAPRPAAKAPRAGVKAAAPASAAEAPAPALTVDAAAERIVEHFRANPKSRPARRAALEKWLASHLRGKLAAEQVPALVEALQARAVLRLEGTKVQYAL
ncbi:MAG: PIN domain-containing protein, partial [Burkholderiaceae bacterium]|nr:PIN domain-containing protein [Burkholderiaceae bacterium]